MVSASSLWALLRSAHRQLKPSNGAHFSTFRRSFMLSFILLPQQKDNNFQRQIAHHVTPTAFICLPSNLLESFFTICCCFFPPAFGNIICQLDASNRNHGNKDMLKFSVQQLLCQRDRRGALVSKRRKCCATSTRVDCFAQKTGPLKISPCQ